MIRISMQDIISIDEKNQRVLVEPMVTIGQLNDYLIELGWTLPIVPELDNLTIGGLVMGGGIESTSHKYGLFQYICTAYELVLGDGNVLHCSADENEELFCGIPFTYGTLGFLTSVEIKIIPYKPYLKLTYEPVFSQNDLVAKFEMASNDSRIDSVEGILYTLHSGVIMSGEFVEENDINPNQVNNIGAWHTEWFYTYVEKIMNNQKPVIEYIPSRAFYHRHNKSWFWLMKYVIESSNHPVFRWLFGWAMPPKYSLLKLLRQKFTPPALFNNFVCQDFIVDINKLKDCLNIVDEQTKIYPIWLCPTRHIVEPHLQDYCLYTKDHLHVDVGVYGFSDIPNFQEIETQKILEKFCLDTKSFVALYAKTELTKEEFMQMFDFNMKIYEKLRIQLNSHKHFPHLYEKISKLGRS